MELQTLPPDREYFNIGEASRIVQLPDYTLRYWETRLRLLRPERRRGGHRRYTRKDLELALRVKHLVRERRMTLAGARKALLRESRGTGSGAPSPASGKGPGADKLLRELRSDLRAILAELS